MVLVSDLLLILVLPIWICELNKMSYDIAGNLLSQLLSIDYDCSMNILGLATEHFGLTNY